MNQAVVVDASALLADIKDEPGADEVRRIMAAASGGLFMRAMNVCEVAYTHIRLGLPESVAFRTATPRGVIIVEDMEPLIWQRAAVLKAKHPSIALGDCVAVSLAESLDADILTGDRLFERIETSATIRIFR